MTHRRASQSISNLLSALVMVSWTSGRLISAGCDRWEYLSNLLMRGGKEFVRIYADEREILMNTK